MKQDHNKFKFDEARKEGVLSSMGTKWATWLFFLLVRRSLYFHPRGSMEGATSRSAVIRTTATALLQPRLATLPFSRLSLSPATSHPG
jgi:hypothetical protein